MFSKFVDDPILGLFSQTMKCFDNLCMRMHVHVRVRIQPFIHAATEEAQRYHQTRK